MRVNALVLAAASADAYASARGDAFTNVDALEEMNAFAS